VEVGGVKLLDLEGVNVKYLLSWGKGEPKKMMGRIKNKELRIKGLERGLRFALLKRIIIPQKTAKLNKNPKNPERDWVKSRQKK